MSFDNLLSQTCIIVRARATGTDRYNNATTVLDTVASGVRCRKTQKTMRMMDERTSEYAYVSVDLVLFPAGTDVQPKDELTIDGDTRVWRVVQDFARRGASEQHHVSVMVEALNARVGDAANE